MKKRFLSIVLALCMVFLFVPSLPVEVGATTGELDEYEVEVSWAYDGNGYYKTFTEAWSSATGATGETPTFKLLKDVDVPGGITVSRKGPTIDLNGKTLTANITINGGTNGSSAKVFTVRGSGALSGTVTAGANYATLQVGDGTVNAAIAENGGTIECIGGTITTATVNAGGTLKCSSGEITNLNVNGGTVTHTGGTATCTGKGKCTVCGTEYLAATGHTGGTATCTKQAVCTVCNTPYGDKDPNNHVGTLGEWQKDANAHWKTYSCCLTVKGAEGTHNFGTNGKCECGAVQIINKLAPEIIEGKGQSLTAGEVCELTFRSNAAYSDFIRVELDGKAVDEKNYTVKEGSTIVTLKADYVATLSADEHTLAIVSTSGTATTIFTVNAKVVNDNTAPATGDNSHMALWFALFLVSGGLLTITGVNGKKKKYSAK